MFILVLFMAAVTAQCYDYEVPSVSGTWKASCGAGELQLRPDPRLTTCKGPSLSSLPSFSSLSPPKEESSSFF